MADENNFMETDASSSLDDIKDTENSDDPNQVVQFNQLKNDLAKQKMLGLQMNRDG